MARALPESAVVVAPLDLVSPPNSFLPTPRTRRAAGEGHGAANAAQQRALCTSSFSAVCVWKGGRALPARALCVFLGLEGVLQLCGSDTEGPARACGPGRAPRFVSVAAVDSPALPPPAQLTTPKASRRGTFDD